MIRSATILIVLMVLGAPLMAACAATPDDDARVAAVGRVADIDVNHGYLIAEFPNGRMFVSIDKRDLGKFIIGDEIRVDNFNRPLPPRPRVPTR